MKPACLTMLMLALSAAPLAAQQNAAPEQLSLELNRAEDSETGGCHLTLVAINRLSQGLTRAAWQVAIFDREGIVQSLPVLDFGALITGKTKVVSFELTGQPCDQIGQVIVNDVAVCTAEGGANLRDICLTRLATRSLADIGFGI